MAFNKKSTGLIPFNFKVANTVKKIAAIETLFIDCEPNEILRSRTAFLIVSSELLLLLFKEISARLAQMHI